MPVQQTDVDELNRAISSGVRSVTVDGETTIMNTTDSLIKARDDQAAQLAEQERRAAGKPARRRQRLLFVAGRGY